MLTLFTIPKPFRGHIGVIQRNALKTWALLRQGCEIMLFGDDEGTAAIARELAVRHVPHVARNEYGTPLVSDIFANADIILLNDLLDALSRIRRQRFLMLGRRWDLDLKEPWDFQDPEWEQNLRADVRRRGRLHSYGGVDYYVFRRGVLGQLPPFAVGRTTYDNWLIWRARSLGVPVIDATRVVTCIHQDHDRTYSSLGIQPPDATDDLTAGVEAKRNLELAGGPKHRFTLRNANWILTSRWLLPALTPWYLWGGLTSRIRAVLPTAWGSHSGRHPATEPLGPLRRNAS